uniref:(2Fe-2S)-binding protein n=1 Tax=Paractinoplanes polyasparticus TaxID=2856853 RepID=UPI0027E1170A|nr:(2Fe-2S)-binding protein [Actinoplanes polyasparticus]
MEDDAAPVLAAIRGAFGTSTRLPGLASDLVVADPAGWTAADGDVEPLLAAARRHWHAQPHVAAALMWKAYSYWLAVPVAFSWVAARRVPRVAASDVLIRLDAQQAPIRLGLRTAVPAAVLASDPLASGPLVPGPAVSVVADEAALLEEVRRVLLDEHAEPLIEAVQRVVRVGRRPLLGSLASNLAHATRHAVRAVPGASAREVGTLLDGLGLDSLVEWTADPAGLVTVRRRTCCLAFTLPQPRLCTDCCFSPEKMARA